MYSAPAKRTQKPWLEIKLNTKLICTDYVIIPFLSLRLQCSLFSPNKVVIVVLLGASHGVLRHRVGLLRLWGDDGVEDVQDGDVLASDLELLLHVLVDQLRVFRRAPALFFPGEVAVVEFLQILGFNFRFSAAV